MVINDIATPLFGGLKNALMWSRGLLVLVGVVALILALNPPPLIGLFAQKGVYGLAAASAAQILFGVLLTRPLPAWMIGMAAATGLAIHLILNLFMGVTNPAVSATAAIGVSVLLVGCYVLLQRK